MSVVWLLFRGSQITAGWLSPSWPEFIHLILHLTKLLLITWWLQRHIGVIWRQFNRPWEIHHYCWRQCFWGFFRVKGYLVQTYLLHVHFPSVINLSCIEEDGFQAKHFCWASTGTYKLELDASDIQVNPVCFTTCRLLLTQPLGVIGSLWQLQLCTSWCSSGNGFWEKDFLCNMLPEHPSSHLICVEAGSSRLCPPKWWA